MATIAIAPWKTERAAGQTRRSAWLLADNITTGFREITVRRLPHRLKAARAPVPRLAVFGLMLAICAGSLRAAPESSPPSPTAITVPLANVKVISSGRAAGGAYSVGIGELLRMADAGVSKEVMQAFVENSSLPFDPAATDYIALKDHKVPDEISIALTKRGAEVRAKSAPALAMAQFTASDRDRAHPELLSQLGVPPLDPDSYDYWLYYHAYPRTLSSVNRRLGAYANGPYAEGAYDPTGIYYSGVAGDDGAPYSRGISIISPRHRAGRSFRSPTHVESVTIRGNSVSYSPGFHRRGVEE